MSSVHVCLACLLGNCLRNVASTKILADFIGYEWNIDLTQSIALPELNQIMQELFPQRIVHLSAGSYPLISERDLFQFVDVYGTNSHPIVEAVVSDVPLSSFGVRHIYAIRHSAMDDNNYIQRKIKFYKYDVLWPNHLLQDVKSFISNEANGSLSNFVGCHIRYTDNLRDQTKCKFNLNTSLSTFIERLKQINNQPIFLCTDNSDIKLLVKEALPNTNILYPNKCTQNSYLWQPVYEMLLLSRTAYLIGSQSSTFSYESSFIGGIDIELFRNNQWNKYRISENKA